jgi:hypothetical protein
LVITLGGLATPADAQAVLQHIGYSNSSEVPLPQRAPLILSPLTATVAPVIAAANGE